MRGGRSCNLQLQWGVNLAGMEPFFLVYMPFLPQFLTGHRSIGCGGCRVWRCHLLKDVTLRSEASDVDSVDV